MPFWVTAMSSGDLPHHSLPLKTPFPASLSPSASFLRDVHAVSKLLPDGQRRHQAEPGESTSTARRLPRSAGLSGACAFSEGSFYINWPVLLKPRGWLWVVTRALNQLRIVLMTSHPPSRPPTDLNLQQLLMMCTVFLALMGLEEVRGEDPHSS